MLEEEEGEAPDPEGLAEAEQPHRPLIPHVGDGGGELTPRPPTTSRCVWVFGMILDGNTST